MYNFFNDESSIMKKKEIIEKMRCIPCFTGFMKVLLRWNFPGHDGDAVATGYQIYVNNRQYGGDIPVQTTSLELEVHSIITPSKYCFYLY